MHVLFIYNGAENIGIAHLSSYLKAQGHSTSLLFDPAVFSGGQFINNNFLAGILSIDQRIITAAIETKPDLIAFSAFTGNYQWCLKIARAIRSRCPTPIVFGGVHVTAVGSEVLQHDFIDYAVRGEGEVALTRLLEYLGKPPQAASLAAVPNLCYRTGGKIVENAIGPYLRDLDALPPADKEIFYAKVPILAENYLIITSRGCPYSCTYCSNNMYHERYEFEANHLRRRSPQSVIDELVAAKRRHNIRLVNFADDVFTASTSWLKEFIALYKTHVDLPFSCSVHPLTISEKTVELLKAGGCWLITMGVQSGSERIRQAIFERKGSNERILGAIEKIKKFGIKISLDNIFGSPTESVGDLELSLQFYLKARPDRLLTFWLTYYPGTKIIEQSLAARCITERDVEAIRIGKIGHTHATGSVPAAMIPTYQKYQIALQLLCLVRNDRWFAIVYRVLGSMPFKGIVSSALFFFNSLKNRDVKVFYVLKYAFSKKLVP